MNKFMNVHTWTHMGMLLQVCICMHVQTCAHVHTFMCAQTHIHASTCIYASMCIIARACANASACTQANVCACTQACACAPKCTFLWFQNPTPQIRLYHGNCLQITSLYLMGANWNLPQGMTPCDCASLFPQFLRFHCWSWSADWWTARHEAQQ